VLVVNINQRLLKLVPLVAACCCNTLWFTLKLTKLTWCMPSRP